MTGSPPSAQSSQRVAPCGANLWDVAKVKGYGVRTETAADRTVECWHASQRAGHRVSSGSRYSIWTETISTSQDGPISATDGSNSTTLVPPGAIALG
jgi:hypothetical protein